MGRERRCRLRKLNHPIKDNSFSIVLFVLFAICISVQSVVGWRLQNDTLAAHAQASISYWHFLATGAFLEGLASNWQAAVLQLGSLIVFSSFLYQRGAPHSRDPGKTKRKHRRREAYRLQLVLPQFAVGGVFSTVCALARLAYRFRHQTLQRATCARGPVADLDRSVSAVG